MKLDRKTLYHIALRHVKPPDWDSFARLGVLRNPIVITMLSCSSRSTVL